MKLRNSLFALLLLILCSCKGDDPFSFEDDFSTVPDPYSIAGITPDTTASGLIIYNLEAGNGELDVTLRDNVRVFYTGRKTDGEIFDSSFKNAQTASVFFQVTNLVEGFTEGLIGMKEGGRRVLVIPPELGYGNYQGNATGLLELRDDTLVFDLQLDSIIF